MDFNGNIYELLDKTIVETKKSPLNKEIASKIRGQLVEIIEFGNVDRAMRYVVDFQPDVGVDAYACVFKKLKDEDKDTYLSKLLNNEELNKNTSNKSIARLSCLISLLIENEQDGKYIFKVLYNLFEIINKVTPIVNQKIDYINKYLFDKSTTKLVELYDNHYSKQEGRFIIENLIFITFTDSINPKTQINSKLHPKGQADILKLCAEINCEYILSDENNRLVVKEMNNWGLKFKSDVYSHEKASVMLKNNLKEEFEKIKNDGQQLISSESSQLPLQYTKKESMENRQVEKLGTVEKILEKKENEKVVEKNHHDNSDKKKAADRYGEIIKNLNYLIKETKICNKENEDLLLSKNILTKEVDGYKENVESLNKDIIDLRNKVSQLNKNINNLNETLNEKNNKYLVALNEKTNLQNKLEEMEIENNMMKENIEKLQSMNSKEKEYEINAFKNKLSSKLAMEYEDYNNLKDMQGEEITEILKETLESVFKKLENQGIKVRKE